MKMKVEFRKEYFFVLVLAAIFMASACQNLTDGGGEEEGNASVIGNYGLKIIRWDVTGDTFLSGESIPVIMDLKDVQDDTPANNIFVNLLGIPTTGEPEVIDIIRDAGTSRIEFTPEAPSVTTETSSQVYARMCYKYKTEASQEFWVVRAGDYQGPKAETGLEMPTLGSSHNEGPVRIALNPSSAIYGGKIRAIEVAKEEGTDSSMGIGVINRGAGFVGNDTESDSSYGTQGRLTNFNLKIPTWDGSISEEDLGDKLSCNSYTREDGSKWWNCTAKNLRMVGIEGRPSASLSPTFNFNLPEGNREKKGRIWASATYRYCLRAPELGVTVRGEV